MKPISRTAVCTVLFLISLGTALAQQVKTDFDHQANFSQYKTYSWQTISFGTRGSKAQSMPNWRPRAGLRSTVEEM
jgi:hypothetical protein